MLEGMLGADVLGFQTRRARNNFSLAARQYTDAEGSFTSLRWQGREIALMEAPIAIDYKFFADLADTPAVKQRTARLREIFSSDAAIVLGVDRLDYTKGIDIRLRAFATLLGALPADRRTLRSGPGGGPDPRKGWGLRAHPRTD